MDDFIGSGHFPFGAEIDSSTTELQLNQMRVQAMGKILFERTLEKIPGNSNQSVEETMMKFAHYVNFFGNVASSDDISNDQLSLRIHVFYFLHQLIFYITKAECVSSEQRAGQSRLPSFGEKFENDAYQMQESLAAKSQTRTRRRSLVQTENSYLHRVVDMFMKGLYQLSQDLIIFNHHSQRVEDILKKFPQISEHMSPFIQQSSLVLLTLISHSSQKFLQKNFFNRPSILAKMLDNFNELDTHMTF